MAVANTQQQTFDFLQQFGELGLTQEDIKELVIATLYHTGKIEGKRACDLLGVARRVFEENVLSKYGFTTYGNTQEDIDIEVENL